MKDKRIIRIKLAAEKDHTISAGAFRLLCRIGSMIYVNPKAKLEDAFALPWSKVGVWMDFSDDKAASRKIKELQDAGYLKCDGLRGCPAMNYFFLVPSCPKKGATSCPTGGATSSVSKGATSCPTGGARHISNSFQEEKIKRKRGEIKSSLRSKVTTETGELAEQARTVGEKQRQLLSQLRGTLGHTAGKSSGSA